MKINKAYLQYKENPCIDTYEDFGKALLQYVSGFVRKFYITAVEEIKEPVIMNSIIRILDEMNTFDSMKSGFSTWVGLKIKNVFDTTWENRLGDNEYQGAYNYHEAPNAYKGAEAKILLKQLMQGLSDAEKSFIKLQLEGYEDQEIADMLGISNEAVRKRWERIKIKMKNCAN
jgi:RNA polymerase sigma factor (sigma-70 family)